MMRDEGSVVELRDEACHAVITMSDSPPPSWHRPVMVQELVTALHPRAGLIVVDGTVGTGGHSLSIVPRLLPDGRLIAMDRDAESLALAQRRLVEFESHATFLHENYRDLSAVLKRLGLRGVDGVLLDLGMSSLHIDHTERGFSFMHDGPLDMRMDRMQEITAATIVNERSAEELERILLEFGEERFASRIARRIVEERRVHPFVTTAQLARVIVGALPSGARHGRLHAATRTFQALRIAVNDELGALRECLAGLREMLLPGGRAAILTFHSLEDRLVKRVFAQGAREGDWTLLTKKPVRPSIDEVRANSRARSAKLRAIERCG